MPDDFQYDVFLSHSAKDQAVVRPLAERLRADGVKHSDFGFRHSDFEFSPPCLSANTFGSDWAQLESGTFRFRDPLNKERRVLPLRLDDARFSLRKKEAALPGATVPAPSRHQPCRLRPSSHRPTEVHGISE